MKTHTAQQQYDVIIAGAGPAGCAAALALKDAGLKVALLDGATFPRDKVCGDAIPSRAVRTLQQIQPELALEFEGFKQQMFTRHTDVVYQGKQLKLHWKTPAYTCARMAFDNWLMEQVKKITATTVYENTRVRGVETSEEGVQLTDAAGNIYHGKILIGADGGQSLVARKLAGQAIDRNHHIGAVRAYYKGVAGVVADTTEIYLDKRYLPGYLWVFPVGNDTVNVGYGMLSADIVRKKVNLKQVLPDFINSIPELKARFDHGQMVGTVAGDSLPLGSRKVRMSGYRFMLAGDAASLIDPISGDGIGNAMLSGRLAALHAVESCRSDNYSAELLQQYDDAVWQKLGKEMRQHTRVQRLLKKMPGILDVSFAICGFEPVRKFLQKRF